MKKLICNHNFTQKILITILILLLFNFVAPTCSKAVTAGEVGGMILNPILDFTSSILDALVGGLQKFLVNGKMNENEFGDGGMVNWFLTKPEIVMENKDGRFDESQYNAQDAGKEQIKEDELDDTYYIPTLQYSPQKIFSGLVPALDINFINPKDWEDEEMNAHSSAAQLHNIIAQWYVALRNFSLVGLMIVLLYVGIRILLSSTASDKSKYKQMLIDWVVAVCLLFFLHYIMTFTVTIVTEISSAVNGNLAQNGNNIAIQITNDSGVATDENEKPIQFNTDLMGQIRFKTQYADAGNKILFNMFYLGMVVYTVMFTVTYLKRVLMMAFLTLIAPVVALTYPIDKIGDGKAQAFNMWLKEYIFNALIQPFHLIIYTVFVSSAITLAATNPFYAIIALGFITQAEKILRKFFGFEKSSTAGALNSFAGTLGGAAAFKAISGIVGKGAKGGGGSKGGNDKIRQKKLTESDKKPKGLSAFAQGNGQEGGQEGGQEDGNGQQPDNAEINTRENSSNNYGNQPDVATIPIGETNRSSNEGVVPNSNTWTSDDNRGVGQWAMDAWNNSEAKQKFSNLAPVRFARDGSESIRDKAAAIKASANNKIGKIPKPIRNTARGAAAVLGQGMKKAGSTGLKLAGRATAAAAMGAIGMAAGIAGDDIGDIFKLGAAGASLGGTVGYNAVGNAVKGVGSLGSNISATYRESAYGVNEARVQTQHREYVKDTENAEYFAENITNDDGSRKSKAEVKQMVEHAATIHDMGIEDNKAIAKVMKTEKIIKDQLAKEGAPQEDIDQMAMDRAITIEKLCSDYTKKDLRKASEVREMRKDFEREFINKHGMSASQASKETDKVVELMRKHQGL